MARLVIRHEAPHYPTSEGSYTSGGAVVLHAVITPQGKIDKLVVISCPDSLRKRALEAVRQWTYKPYELNGSAVWVQTTVTMNIDFGA
jgi:TonB family protein